MSGGPRLRAVEAFPVEQEGRRYVALRDPAGYVSEVIMLPVDLVEILALFERDMAPRARIHCNRCVFRHARSADRFRTGGP